MASLSSLRSDLNYWNNRLSNLNDKLRKLKRRKSDIEEVKKALGTTINNNSADINKRIRLTRQNLERSIEYTGKEVYLDAIFSNKEERTLGLDDNLTSADNELRNEHSEVVRQISETEAAITNARTRINSIKAEITAEERRRREAAAQAAVEAIKNLFK